MSRQEKKRFEEAEKISEEEFPLDFKVYRICPDKKEQEPSVDRKAAENNRVDVQVEKNFQMLQVSFQYEGEEEKQRMEEIVKDIYLYYGVTEEDKEKGTERFLMLANILEGQSK